MDEIWERNYKNSEKIRNRRRRILINRIMNQHKVDLLEKKYEEIMKEWNSMEKKPNVNYKWEDQDVVKVFVDLEGQDKEELEDLEDLELDKEDLELDKGELEEIELEELELDK